MLTGKQLILATKPFAKEVRYKSWLYTLSTLLLLLLSLLGTLFFHSLFLKLACSIVAGLLTSRMFVIYHDYMHHTILNRSVLAKGIMTVFGIYALAPTSIWKRSHDYHHKHNSKLFSASIGSYPILTKKKFLALTENQRRAYLATRHPFTIIFGYFSMFFIGMCYRSFKCAPSKHVDSLIAIIIHITAAVLVTIYMGWQGLIFTVFIPFFIPGALGAYLFYAQHNFPGVTFADNDTWNYEKAAMKSSSYMVMNPFMNWVTANIGYHHIHHLNSHVPFYRLPEAMAAIPELQFAKRTSLKFSDIKACFRLKVWDAENGEMIGLAQICEQVNELKPSSVI